MRRTWPWGLVARALSVFPSLLSPRAAAVSVAPCLLHLVCFTLSGSLVWQVNRQFLLDEREEAQALGAAASVVMAYAYDERMTGGEGSTESAWTVAKLSAALSWLEPLPTAR